MCFYVQQVDNRQIIYYKGTKKLLIIFHMDYVNHVFVRFHL
jgi:hypothetical protein